ncbi:MAG: NYN domain-containing protein [Deltaproteobacteria bacterium]|jgi:uncharacterized LabA/DUF88 family protein|nr:NYN domain-containing protein [Deltaproteobacteria bacterium]
MMKNRVLVFVDEANVTRAASKGFNKSFDWVKFRDFLMNSGDAPRELVEMAVYIGLHPDPLKRQAQLRYVNFLQTLGFLVYTKEGQWIQCSDQRRGNGGREGEAESQDRQACGRQGAADSRDGKPSYKSNVDVIMAIDAMDLTNRIRPDVVIIVTGDSDFAHLASTIRREGIKVEVAAIPQTLSSLLKKAANRVIDLTDLISSFDDYRSAERPPALCFPQPAAGL